MGASIFLRRFGHFLFPYALEHEAWERILESSDYGILEDFFLPVLDLVLDCSFPQAGLTEALTPLPPNQSRPVASLQEMIHCFLCFAT